MELPILEIQPSQFYLSRKKLTQVRSWLKDMAPSMFEPLPIKKIGNRIFFTDGHTRAFVAHELGWEKIPVVWDEDTLNWENYLVCVQEAESNGVRTVADFTNRILEDEDYQKKWLGWCDTLFK